MRAFPVMLMVVFLAAGLARAQVPDATPSSAHPADVDVALRAALAAYEAGDLPLADALLHEVHAQEPSARSLRGMGVVAYRQGRYCEAVGLLERSMVHPVKPLTDELRAGVAELLFDANQRTGRLMLTRAPADADVRVDGAEPVSLPNGQFILTPGPHAVVVTAQGRDSVRLGVVTTAGARQEMRVELPVAVKANTNVGAVVLPAVPVSTARLVRPSGPMQKSPSTTAPRSKQRTLPARLRRASYGLVSTSVAALVVAVVSGGLGVARVNDIESHCRKQPGGQCTEGDLRARTREGKLTLLGNLATASWIATGVTAGAGVGLYGWAWRASHHPQTTSYSLGISGRF